MIDQSMFLYNYLIKRAYKQIMSIRDIYKRIESDGLTWIKAFAGWYDVVYLKGIAPNEVAHYPSITWHYATSSSEPLVFFLKYLKTFESL